MEVFDWERNITQFGIVVEIGRSRATLIFTFVVKFTVNNSIKHKIDFGSRAVFKPKILEDGTVQLKKKA